MKLKTNLLIMTAVLLLAIPMVFMGNAGAVTYNPDGAVLNGTTGLWETPAVSTPSDYNNCLACHQAGGSAPAKEGYLNASHKNASRKIVAGSGLANVYLDSDGVEQFGIFPYLPAGAAQTDGTNGTTTTYNLRRVDWLNGKIEDTTANASYVGLRNLPTGIYTTWYWEFGYYGEDPERGLYASIADTNGKPAAKQAGCFFCHATGLVASNTLDSTKEPEISFPGISWNGTTTYTKGSRIVQVNFQNSIVRENNGTTLYTSGLCAEVGGTAYGTTTAGATFTYGSIGSLTESMTKTTTANGGTCTSSCDADNDGDGICEANETCLSENMAKTTTANGGTCTSSCDADNDGDGICETNETCTDVAVTVNNTYKCVKTYTSEGANKTACTTGGTTANGGLWSGSWTKNDKYFALVGTHSCNITFTYKYNAWDQFGITCSNCHNAVDGLHESSGPRKNIAWGSSTAVEGASINAVCGQCHVRASSSTAMVTAPDTESVTLRKYVGTGHPNYHASDFLNSPHARFTGVYSEIADTTKYNSDFLTNYGGCTGCHNPHGSVREPLIELTEGTSAEPLEGIETTCAACHATTQASTPAITTINHPTGTATPDDTNNACVTCHMPNGRHLFRITTDANYTTTQPTAFPEKADGTFTEAVWIDMKSACGQCHSGHVVEEAPQLTNAQLAQAAAGMHGGELTTNCTACHTVFTKLPAKHPSGNGTPTACTSCHSIPHSGAVNTDTLCGQCHGGSAGPSATSNGAPYIGKSFLSTYAENMHSNVTTPTASMDKDVSSYTVTLTDTSTDDKAFPASAVKVQWGDGTSSTGDAGSDFEHTYGADGKYLIVYTVKDSDGQSSRIYRYVYIPERFSIVVNISPALSSKATFVLKKNGVIKSEGTGKTSYTFTKLKPGTYQVKIKKLGYAFDGDAVTEGNQNPLTVVIGASDQTVTFTHTP